MNLEQIGQAAKKAAYELGQIDTSTKNKLLLKIAASLEESIPEILAENHIDIEEAKRNDMATPMLDRLRLDEKRIRDMTESIRQVALLPDPIGQVDSTWRNEDGLMIGRQIVPIGVIAMIYEARPNVTTDAASLCFKSGNAIVLRGGKEAFHTNLKLTELMRSALIGTEASPNAIQMVMDTSRETAKQLMTLNQYLDVLIPRGGANLIQTVRKTATVPVIETGTGNCHLYVDKEAQLEMATNILVNAKCQRPSVCNAVETLLIHQEVAAEYLPVFEKKLAEHGVVLHADCTAAQHLNTSIPANEKDWETEYLDYHLAIKVVASIEDAISHINYYNTKHSEAIVTDNYFAAQQFLKQVDAAAVYVNASTRFTDGFAFGFGGEIGISTQKLHARGPMGLAQLTSSKYIIYGEGQYRS